MVRDSEGPIEAARFLELDPDEWERGGAPIILGRSGVGGRFELFVDGYPAIRVEAEGHRPLDLPFWDDSTELVLERATRLTGTLTTHDDRAVPGARVSAKCGSHVMLPVQTDETGRFALDGVTAMDPCRIVFDAPHLPCLAVEESSPEGERRYRLDPPARLIVHVMDRADQIPIDDVFYALSGDRCGAPGRWSDKIMSAEGRFEIDGLNAGQYRLDVKAHLYVPTRVHPLVLSGAENELKVELAPAGGISGRVEWDGVAPTHLLVLDRAGAIVESSPVLTDSRFFIGWLPPDRYQVVLYLGEPGHPKSIALSLPQNLRLELRLEKEQVLRFAPAPAQQ